MPTSGPPLVTATATIQPAPRVTAVLLSYNSLETLRHAVEAVRGQTRPVDRFLVVDNGSQDGSAEWLSRSFGQADVVLVANNLGVGAGHGLGWQRALSDTCAYVWALEHDTVPAPDCLEMLMDTADRFPRAVVVPRQLLPHRTPHRTHGMVTRAHRRAIRRARSRIDAVGLPGPVPSFSFNATLLPASVLREVRGPRADFVVGKEDRELSWRLRDHGVCFLRVPTATVKHLHANAGGLLTPLRLYYSTRNTTYLRVHLGRERGAVVRTGGRLVLGCVKVVLLGSDKQLRLKARVTGWWDGVRGRMGFTSRTFSRVGREVS